VKLLSVSVEGCGRFGKPARIEGLGPGVNILSAGNEAGKSTLFRAIRTCLFERHGAGHKDIKSLATEGLSLPLNIGLSFEHEGRVYELSKSFLKSPSASLRCDGTETARNREADELIWELLGIKPENKVDLATYGLLWVEQGHSFYVPEPTEGAASVLNNVIQQEVGTLVGGERARKLLNGIGEQLDNFITSTGKPKKNGPLDMAETHVQTLAKDLEDAEARLRELDQSLDALLRLRSELVRAAEPAESQRLAAELKEAEQQLKAAEETAEAIRRCETDERHIHDLLRAEEAKLSGLVDRARRIDENESRIKQLRAALIPLNEEESAVQLSLNDAGTRRHDIDLKQEAVEQQERLLQRLAVLAERHASTGALKERIEVLQSLESRLALNAAALKENDVDEAALRALESIERETQSLSARIEAVAARLTIESKTGGEVTVNGREIKGNLVRSVTEPLTIAVGKDVTITIAPPASTQAAAEEKLGEQQSKLKILLARHGVGTPAELRILRTRRMELEEQARVLRAQHMALGVREESAAAEIQRLAAELHVTQAEIQRTLGETGAAELPPSHAISEKRDAMQAELAGLKQLRAQCDGIVSAQSKNLSRIARDRGSLEGEAKAAEVVLFGDLDLLPHERRADMIQSAERSAEARRAEHRTMAALLAQMKQQAPEPDAIDRLRMRCDRLRAALANRAREAESLREKIAHLEGQVQIAGGDGLGERVAELKSELLIAHAEHERLKERIEVLRLLKLTVEQSYARRREQLSAPLRRHLKPFLDDVFPQAELEFGDDFVVSALRRSGPSAELFGRLSHGTQEQLAVLVRLAMGAMICEKGPDVPIILDDALVFSDDARIEAMFDAINRAGRNQQVIVFTCRARSFASLGGRQLHIA
jgi:DNA repair exonuclease SbcCD ATPase subunit